MKKAFSILLMLLLPMTLFVSCGDKDDPDGIKGFEYPIMKWGVAPSYVLKHQKGTLIEDPSNLNGDNAYTFQLSDSKTWAVCYLFDDQDKLYASSIVVEKTYEDDLYEWLAGQKYEYVDLGIDMTTFMSSKHKDSFLLIQDLPSDLKYNIKGKMALFMSIDFIFSMPEKSVENSEILTKVFNNRDVIIKAFNNQIEE